MVTENLVSVSKVQGLVGAAKEYTISSPIPSLQTSPVALKTSLAGWYSCYF